MRGILRVSGPGAVRVLERCFLPQEPLSLADQHVARMISGWLLLPAPFGPLESDLYLWPDARSYTRQPSAEIHTLGAPVLLQSALGVVCQAGARLAEPGEFTLRAFLAGRIDLLQAEAVLGVIDARDERQLQSALRQLAGGLATPLHQARQAMLELLADLEAGLDFADEDLEFLSRGRLRRGLRHCARQIATVRRQLRHRAQDDDSPRVVLTGLPNVGKSSLFNALLDLPAAITSPRPGTTRDYLVRPLVLEGQELLLIDTAGYSQVPAGECDVTQAAQQLREEQVERAELTLLCLDSTRPLLPWETAQLARSSPRTALVVWTKSDLPRAAGLPETGTWTSSRSGQGLRELRSAILAELTARVTGEACAVIGTAARCRESLRRAARCLERARRLVAAEWGDELVAAEIRLALDELGKVVGAVYTDEILDLVFSRFCIGK